MCPNPRCPPISDTAIGNTVAHAPRVAVEYATIALSLILIAILSYLRLKGTPLEIDFSAAVDGISTVFGATFFAALKIWTCWTLFTIVGAGILLRLDDEMSFFDAILGGAAGGWVAAWILGQILGPIGLFRAPVIWLLLLVCGAGILLTPVRPRASRLTAGQGLALLAFALAAVGLLPLELGSPVAPYMDVLACPASVQRILSFGRYLPMSNDPYGLWGPQAQTPALELFLSMLAMSSRTQLGILAQSGGIIPMAALMIFGAYRLGAAMLGDAAGGVAALMLFFTNTFRRMVGMRGTAVAFALVALGLALVLDRKSRRLLVAFGSLILGTSVATHAIDGGFAIVVAGLAIFWREASRPRVMLLKLTCVAGAVIFAGPEFAIANRTPLPYPLLPLILLAGLATVVVAARALPPTDADSHFDNETRWRDAVIVVIFAGALIYTITQDPNSIFAQIFQQFPMLTIFAAIGLLYIGAMRGPDAQSIDGSALVIALLITLIVEALGRKLGALGGSNAYQSNIADLHYKLDEYWTPFFLIFPAAVPFAIVFNHGRRAMVVAALLAILIYPWYPRPNENYDYEEHSIAENWAIDLRTAADGYWIGTPDSRWTMGAKEMELVDLLWQEQAAGRINIKTHILHLAQDVIVWHECNRFSVYTGIMDDPIVYDIPYSDVGWLAGGRVRQMPALSDAIAARPPYILAQVAAPFGVKFPPDDYDLIFNREQLQLYRRRDLVAGK
ncbi:MAG TPA: hypothetical protein VKV03_08485 [Candidatus Binataceae bacterium]|nr:hypothetical protein [Candidatus Binataceae bacterium]